MRGKANQQWRMRLLQVGTFVVLLVLWEALSRSGLGLKELFPSVEAIAASLLARLEQATFWAHVGTSAYEIGLGFVLGGLTGLVIGLVTGGSRYWRRVLEPILINAFAVPLIVVYPLLILAYGLGVGSKVAMAALSAFFPVALTTLSAYYQLRPVYLRVAQVHQLGAWRTYTRVVLPAIAGPVLDGLRLGFGTALVGALLAETKQSRGGLGFQAMDFYQRFQVADMYAVILFVFLASASLNLAFTKVSEHLTRTRRSGDLLG